MEVAKLSGAGGDTRDTSTNRSGGARGPDMARTGHDPRDPSTSLPVFVSLLPAGYPRDLTHLRRSLARLALVCSSKSHHFNHESPEVGPTVAVLINSILFYKVPRRWGQGSSVKFNTLTL